MRLMSHNYTHLANVPKAKAASGDRHFQSFHPYASLKSSGAVSSPAASASAPSCLELYQDIGHSKMHCPGPNAILSSKPYSLGASVHASAPMPSRATSNMRHSNLHRSIAIITPTFSGIAPSNQYHIDTKLNTLH